MRLTPKSLKRIERFAVSKMKNNDIIHRKDHIDRVINLCRILAKKEKADFKICKAAVLLHDIKKNKKGDHAYKSAKTAEGLLRKIKLDKNIIKQICYAIYRHNKGLPNKTVESRVAHDADNLDGIGPSGFLKHVIYGIIAKKLNFNQSIRYAVKEHEKFYKWLQTKSAKKIGKQRMGKAKDFLKYLRKEELPAPIS